MSAALIKCLPVRQCVNDQAAASLFVFAGEKQIRIRDERHRSVASNFQDFSAALQIPQANRIVSAS